MTRYIGNHKLLFVHVPKTGGSSIKSWMQENFTESYMVKRVHSTYNEVIDLIDSDATSFAVCRNPWDRQVSHYFYEIKKSQGRLKKVKEGTINKPHKLKWNAEYLENHIDKLINGGFENYIREKDLWYLGNFSAFSTQNSVIGNCDIVLRFENLNKEFKRIQEITNCFAPLPTKNTTNHLHYKEYYTSQDLIDIVSKHFAEDIKKFNYVF